MFAKRKSIQPVLLEATNHYYDIMPGDKFVVTDTGDEPENAECHWYELVPLNMRIVLNAWNDKEHLVVDENFDRLEPRVFTNQYFQEIIEDDFARAIEIIKRIIKNNF